MHFDRDNIPDPVIKKISAYIDRDDFEPAQIKKASVACEAICMWVRAMYKYHWVAKAVEPKKQKLREAEYEEAVRKQEDLAREIEDCQVRMERAQKLIGGLGGEKSRWSELVKTLGEEQKLLPGDSLVASGMLAYGGPF